jgi:BON domain
VADHDEGVVGIALAAAAAFGLGLMAGLVASEWLGGVDAARVRRAVDRLRPELPPADRAALEGAVRRALRAQAATRYLKITVRAAGPGLIELTGRVGDAVARERAGTVAREAMPGCTVINRLLVAGEDVPRGPAAAAPDRP